MTTTSTAGYRKLSPTTVPPFIANVPALAERLGGQQNDWSVREVSDGYLNFVFLVDGPDGSVCVKQSLPHVRVDESWPVPLERNLGEKHWFEHLAPHVGRAIPEIYHHDPQLFTLVIETLRPHEVLRTALIEGRRYPNVARDVADFVARSTFFSSDFFQPYETKQEIIARLRSNDPMHRIMRELVFRDPFYDTPRNHWTTPQLDDIVAGFYSDPQLRIAASRIGHKFMTSTQALVHSDLHAGAIMLSADDTRVIDPEFGVYGAIAIDTGAFIGHLFIAYFSQPGHATAEDDRRDFQAWILASVEEFWNEFRARFLALWRQHGGGDAYERCVFADAAGVEALDAERERFLDEIWADTLAFAAVKIIRSIIGYSHFGEMESIADLDQKAASEAGALSLGRLLLLQPQRFTTIADVVAAARRLEVPKQAPGRRLAFATLDGEASR